MSQLHPCIHPKLIDPEEFHSKLPAGGNRFHRENSGVGEQQPKPGAAQQHKHAEQQISSELQLLLSSDRSNQHVTTTPAWTGKAVKVKDTQTDDDNPLHTS